jgi:hypothetical protein
MMAYKVHWLWENVIPYKKGEFVERNNPLLATKMHLQLRICNRSKKKTQSYLKRLFVCYPDFIFNLVCTSFFLYCHKNIAAVLCMIWHCRLSVDTIGASAITFVLVYFWHYSIFRWWTRRYQKRGTRWKYQIFWEGWFQVSFIKTYTVKPAQVVTSIKQSPVLKV